MECLETSTKKHRSLTYYDILGCDQNSSQEQINCEFKLLALQNHPDKNPDKAESIERFQQLLEAKEALTDLKTREKYDFWLNSGICMPWKAWYEFSTRNKTVFHWVVTKPEPMISDTKHVDTRENGAVKDEIESFRYEQKKSDTEDLLSKFRNYKI